MKTTTAPVDSLKPHPRNYRSHPEDQLAHVEQSLRDNGVYRPVIVAKDDTILAGHGLVQAAKNIGLDELPVVRLDLDPDDPRAIKVLVGDNEIARTAEVQDRALTDLVKEIKDMEGDLLGTGFNLEQLAALVLTTRTEDEIGGPDEAAEWVGMPEFEPQDKRPKLIVAFDDEEAREKFMKSCGIHTVSKTHGHGQVWSVNWPPQGKDDLVASEFVVEE